MGRVARYKKVKSVDPFAKRKAGEVNPLYEPKRGKRRRHGAKPIEFDLVPKKEDNFNGTFTSSDDVAKGKKQKSSQSKHNVELSKKLGFQVFDLKEEAHMARFLQEDARSMNKKAKKRAKNGDNSVGKVNKNGQQNHIQDRFEGESMRAFEKRVKQETAQILKRELRPLGTKKKTKRNEFLKMKKAKKKGKTIAGILNARNIDESEDENNMDMPVFGDQVERPPEFKQLPRGALAKKQNKRSGNATNEAGLLKDEKQIAEQRNLEKLRERVQQQYAAIKAQRKKEGQFHL